ncbi:MAG: hypothetical protein HY881_23120 [Deltaproteobacteria bacterium]|nr:hypothetical protein [Deltaproteobacteria bacterium]
MFRFMQVFFLIMVAVVSFNGCNGRLFSYKGVTITQKNRMVQLQQGDHQGIWKTNELELNYHYQMLPETLNISGTVNLVGGFATGFSSVDRLVVQLLFLNNQGTVIENFIVYSANNYHSINYIPMIFDRTIPIPAETHAISFTYDGMLSDGGGDGPTGISIWNFPH